MTEEIALYLQDMEIFLTPAEYQGFLKAKETVEHYWKEADDYVDKVSAVRRLVAEYQGKIDQTQDHFEQSRLRAEVIRLTVGRASPSAPHMPGYQCKEYDRYIGLARERKVSHLQEQERMKAKEEAERRREERLTKIGNQKKIDADKMWKSFIVGFYNTIEELKHKIAGNKPAKLQAHYSSKVFDYHPHCWCELTLPNDKDIKAWARPQVLEVIPHVLRPFVSIVITPQLVVIPRVEYQLLGCPCLTWHFDIYATAKAGLHLKESTVTKEFNGWRYSAPLAAEKLGQIFLGYCLWDSEEGFSVPLALLRLIVNKETEGVGIEVLSQDSGHTVYIVDGYEEDFVEVLKEFIDYIRVVGSDQPLSQALLSQGLVDEDTAKLVEAKWDEPLPVTAKVTTGNGPDLEAITAKLLELGWAAVDVEHAMGSVIIPENAITEDILKAILEKPCG